MNYGAKTNQRSEPPPKPVRRAARRTQEERSTETRRKLVNATIELIHESGFARLTVTNVANRAGLTTGAMQHHYPSSRDLIRDTVETIYPVLRVSIEDPTSTDIPPSERADHLIDVYWKIYRRPEYLVFWDLTFGTRNQPDLRDTLRSFQKDIVTGMIAELVRVFSDIGMSPRAASELWTFIGNQLRGLALLTMYEDAPVLDTDIRLLKTAAHHLIATLTAKPKRT